jgi:hypothetical protein
VNRALVKIIEFYKKFVSPALEKVFGKACRFTPTCSEYTIGALERFGTKKGIVLGFKRFVRCHPWGGSGYDPVPTLSRNK